MDVIGSIYIGASEKFQRGIHPIARCIKSEIHDLAVVYTVRSDDMSEKILGNIYGFDGGNYAGNVYAVNCEAPTIRTYQGGNQQPMIIVTKALNAMPDGTCRTIKSQYYKNGIDNFDNQSSFGATGVITVTSYILQLPRGYNKGGCHEICPAITSNCFQENNFVVRQLKIRKLTPLECWRLMGFADEDFRKAEEVNSNTQLHKQAGNSIVKNVLTAILGQMIPGKENAYKNCQQKGCATVNVKTRIMGTETNAVVTIASQNYKNEITD